MGRIKVYGGSWNLPDAPLVEDPFSVYYRSLDAKCERRREAATRVEPPVDKQPPPPRSSLTTDDDSDDKIWIDITTQPQSP
jgi:hypothetical protein